MTEMPTQVVVAVFEDSYGARAALERLKGASDERLMKVKAAVLEKSYDGTLTVKETADMSGGKGAAIGGVLGGVIGLLAGPVGWAAVGGAVIGGLAAKLRDGGFPDEQLQQTGESLKPGASALVAVIDERYLAQVEEALRQTGATVVREAINADTANELEAAVSDEETPPG